MNATQRIIGLMSGTSLDGVDLVFAEFQYLNHRWKWNIIACDCLEYTEEWRNQLSQAHKLNAEDLSKLNTDYAKLLGDMTHAFISKFKLEKIDAIASHGHTVFHQPANGFTLQIGSGAHLQAQLNLKVISDFRSQDIALGGQGTPLVPIGDQLLFSEYDACVNLGGFANISFDNEAQQRIAFDICPVNYILNHLCQKLGKNYDADGEIARNSRIDEVLFHHLNQIEFYHQKSPKSLGREWVENEIFPWLENTNVAIENQISTITHHAAFQISNILNQHAFKKVLFSGGGTKNQFLMRLIQDQTEVEIHKADDIIIDFKEALIFAFLGCLKLRNEINVLSSVTGAKRDSSSGIIYD